MVKPHYLPLDAEDHTDSQSYPRHDYHGPDLPPKTLNTWKMAFLLSLFINVLLFALLAYDTNGTLRDLLTSRNRFPVQGQLTYTPAEPSIEYKLVKFHLGLGHDIPIYEQQPSPLVDEAWNELTKYALARIPKSEMSRMPNNTWPVPNTADSPEYMVAPDVFHALHCLDLLRMLNWPEHYSDSFPLFQKGHFEHCVGHIRQSLMCFGDMTPNVYQWSRNHGQAFMRTDVAHTCRDFDKLKQWMDDHWLDFDEEAFRLDIFGNPVPWSSQ
ncbi:hypothetical protein K435DRAFT_782575 [Dendrothele bispora CBS 962.96]|uniref:Uncharacterized protein n=1 Tax=Dendrothele bispora (strain CBS 962.96) TaxID=1314807 RepID=A0A4S8LDY5_DENBC|nr:hypothetical protein K435DRAFT_782575 [Dendrothele bispora CBS 962.96]